MEHHQLASMQMSLMLLTRQVDVLEQKVKSLEQKSETPYIKSSQGQTAVMGGSLGDYNPSAGFVSLNKAGAMGEPQRTGVIGPDSNAKTILEYRTFIEGLCDMNGLGMNVTEEVRNAARKVLGR